MIFSVQDCTSSGYTINGVMDIQATLCAMDMQSMAIRLARHSEAGSVATLLLALLRLPRIPPSTIVAVITNVALGILLMTLRLRSKSVAAATGVRRKRHAH